MDNSATLNTEKTLTISNDLLKLSKMLPQMLGHTPVNFIEGLYYILNQIDDGDVYADEESTEGQFMGLIDEVAGSLKGLPLYYHVQLLRQFVNRYFDEILHQKSKENRKLTREISDSLMDETRYVYKTLSHLTKSKDNRRNLLSPFEVIYIYVDCMIDDRPQANEQEMSNFESIIKRNTEYQKSVVLSYLDKYEAKYGDYLKKEGFKNEKG